MSVRHSRPAGQCWENARIGNQMGITSLMDALFHSSMLQGHTQGALSP